MLTAYISMLMVARFPAPDEAAYQKFVGGLSSSARNVWVAELPRKDGFGLEYKAPSVLLFHDSTTTTLGTVVGTPYYYPTDSTLYIERTHFAEFDAKLVRGKAEFAQAYVFAWLTAKHVLNQTGHLKLVANARGTRTENELIVRANLCASYLAGVWAHHAQKEHKFLTPKDAEEVITTVRVLADDRVMQRGKKAVSEAWGHGTSEQHVRFFLEGMKTGDASKARIDRFFSDKYDPSTASLIAK